MKPVLFSATANPASSRQFYEQMLGLRFVEDGPFALVFDADGIMLRIQKVEQVVPLPYTLLGFEVADIAVKVSELASKGVVFQRYDFLPQDDAGIWTTDDGARIAWFQDPDGNTLSLTQTVAGAQES